MPVMSAPASSRLSHSEYLRTERAREIKHEYLDGLERAMAGGTIEHGRLASRFAQLVGTELRERPCEVFSADVRIRIEASNRSVYPDASIVCGEIQRAVSDSEAVANPLLIAEVLSESSEAYDRGEKFRHYRRLDSLREYVLISQHEPLVEVWQRDGTSWSVHDYGPGQWVRLVSIDVVIPVDSLYHNPLPHDAH